MAKLRYLRGNGAELIICEQSTISYPLHNHVSVYTLGFVSEGAVELVTDQGRRIYRENETFIVSPYTPHCINAASCYTLLSLCIRAELMHDIKPERNISDVADFLHNTIKHPGSRGKILPGPVLPFSNQPDDSRGERNGCQSIKNETGKTS